MDAFPPLALLVGLGMGLSGLAAWAFWRLTRGPRSVPGVSEAPGREPLPGSDYHQGHEDDPWGLDD